MPRARARNARAGAREFARLDEIHYDALKAP